MLGDKCGVYDQDGDGSQAPGLLLNDWNDFVSLPFTNQRHIDIEMMELCVEVSGDFTSIDGTGIIATVTFYTPVPGVRNYANPGEKVTVPWNFLFNIEAILAPPYNYTIVMPGNYDNPENKEYLGVSAGVNDDGNTVELPSNGQRIPSKWGKYEGRDF